MWRLVVLFLLPVSALAETYYLVHAGRPDIRRNGDRYDVSIDFHNNGGKAARCTAEENNDSQQFTIRPYGDAKVEFERVSDVRPVNYGCEAR